MELIVLGQSIFIIIGVYLAYSKASYFKHKIDCYNFDDVTYDNELAQMILKNNALTAENKLLKSECLVVDNQINNLIVKMNGAA